LIIDMTDCAPFTWTVVIPVKVLSRAKSRLASLAGARRADLALAFACDTVSAAMAVPAITRVVVVTADEQVRRAVSTLGASVVTEEPADDGADGLNAALRLGAAGDSGAIAGLTADLPALRPAELARALCRVGDSASFVPDQQGTGTTLYATAPGTQFRPMFGGLSRDRHAANGCRELRMDDAPGLRRDVDTPEDLMAAVALGLGAHTAPVVANLLRYAQQDRSASA
jgi:2-phospho-L-lactate guanylyltransferase